MHSKKSVSIAKRSRPRAKREFRAVVQPDRSILLWLARRRIEVYVRPSLVDVFLKIVDSEEIEHPEISLGRVDEPP
ncbi:hypothetical protein GNZ12_34100 [Paraburkholderia sp. 1N]|uniref:Uncharacterized protein n=1 Tax=Paraburkholderia solitsugae TaxID=2675748 RepID=A0ABX2C1B5_9BURK|nr:hypothetical protein [Paraburkholderia solitsugae]NPT42372.1 hypothetical protein [Paraburkholderia solitsugae]NPT46271.1 hypothetical protein [Paraburkholderia solitsugae]